MPFFCDPAFAAGARKLNVGAEVEDGVTVLDRNPKPAQADTGLKFFQDYRLTADGEMFKHGSLDAEGGVKIDDRYSGNTGAFEDKVRFDYGPWLRLDTLTRRDTDEEIFFLGTNEPQSPIHTVRKKNGARLAWARRGFVEYEQESRERKDLFLGTVVNEDTKMQTGRGQITNEVWDVEGEYQTTDFKDLLGARSDVDSQDLLADVRFKPKKSLAFSAAYEEDKDSDRDNRTELHSRDARFDTLVQLQKALKVRARLRASDDDDTRTNEDIERKSGELIVNFDPSRHVGVQGSYKKEDEDKDRGSATEAKVDSARDDGRVQITFTPVSPVTVRGGYEVSDKGSSLASENLRDGKIFSDLALKLFENLRLGGNFSNLKSKNTRDSTFESGTDILSFNLQHRPSKIVTSLARLDFGKTNNPQTGAYTKTNTLSANINLEPARLWGLSFRTSGQTTEGSSQNASSRRWLNGVKVELRPLRSLKFAIEYELVNSRGTIRSDENLVDLDVIYSLRRFDFSLRGQVRDIAGDNATVKKTVLFTIKYRLKKDVVFSLRFSLTDYEDRVAAANTYDAVSFENLLSLKF